jgi:hypothetical protein
VERGRDRAHCAGASASHGIQIRVTFQADRAHFGPRQHFRIDGPVRNMTTRTAFQPDWGVLENKRPAKVRVAGETRRLIAESDSPSAGGALRMGIMTIRAGHRALRQGVSVRPLEGRPGRLVAVTTLRVNADVASLNQCLPRRRMDRVASAASNLIVGVSGCDPSGSRRLIQMAA